MGDTKGSEMPNIYHDFNNLAKFIVGHYKIVFKIMESSELHITDIVKISKCGLSY